MPKTITLRLKDREYGLFRAYAEADHRTLVGDEEMRGIVADGKLMGEIKIGHAQAKQRKGKFVA